MNEEISREEESARIFNRIKDQMQIGYIPPESGYIFSALEDIALSLAIIADEMRKITKEEKT